MLYLFLIQRVNSQLCAPSTIITSLITFNVIRYALKVVYLQGSAMRTRDLRRASVHTARYV